MRQLEMLSRRSFLFCFGGVAALAVLSPAIYADAQEAYVLWPHETWLQEFDLDYCEHRTTFRPYGLANWPDGHVFGVGMRLTAQAVEDGLAPNLIQNYNRALENFKRQFGFSSEMLRLAAQGKYSGRWRLKEGAWERLPASSCDINAISEANDVGFGDMPRKNRIDGRCDAKA